MNDTDDDIGELVLELKELVPDKNMYLDYVLYDEEKAYRIDIHLHPDLEKIIDRAIEKALK